MEIYSVLITGASRGIGFEFVKQFLISPLIKSRIIIATCRSPSTASALLELKRKYDNLHVLKLDLTEFSTFDFVANEVQNIVGDKGLTLLINNAGINGGINGGPSSDFNSVTAEKFMAVLATNTVGPVLLTKALLPLLKQSADVNAAKTKNGLSIARAAVINISSDLGSSQVSEEEKGPWFYAYCYNESKAALNKSSIMLGRKFLKDGILVHPIHPGHVSTDMGGQKAAVDPTTSVTGMLKVMLKLKEPISKGYYDWTGNLVPF